MDDDSKEDSRGRLEKVKTSKWATFPEHGQLNLVRGQADINGSVASAQWHFIKDI